MTRIRTTHTYATLPISVIAWNEIAAKLRAAGSGDAIAEDASIGHHAIDMQGIGLIMEEPGNGMPVWHCAFCGHGEYVTRNDWARALERRHGHEAQCNRRPAGLADPVTCDHWQLAERVESIVKRIETGEQWQPQPESYGHLRRWLFDSLKTIATALRRTP